MNDALRILDKLLRKSGYVIKKHFEYNLLPLNEFRNYSDQKNVYETFNKNKNEKESNIGDLEICLRTCINKHRKGQAHNKLTNVSTEKHLLKCIRSLVIAVNTAVKQNFKIHMCIFDDHSDSDALKNITKMLDGLECKWEIITTKKEGQGESLHQVFSHARDCNKLFYFCEDDYLHVQNAIIEMCAFYQTIFKQTSKHLLIHPQEHELIYSQYNYPSYILIGQNRRWRTISHSTHTFFTHSHVVKEYWNYFENTKFVGNKAKRHLGAEKKTTDKLFRHIPGFSPIPAVAVHLQTENCLPPFFDWKKIWEKIK